MLIDTDQRQRLAGGGSTAGTADTVYVMPRNRKVEPRSPWAIAVLMAVQRNRQTTAHAVVVRANPLPRKSVSVQAG